MAGRGARAAAALIGGVGLAAAATPSFCDGRGSVHVEALVFSGTPNPSFELHDGALQSLCLLLGAATSLEPAPTCRAVGFVGWKLCPQTGEACTTLRGERRLDTFLLGHLSAHHAALPTPVFQHIMEEAERLAKGGDPHCKDVVLTPAGGDCTKVPIRGPNDPKVLKFDPQHDDGGCFVTEQDMNNCYDYANDIVTNSFAQPGRGSGVCPPGTRPCVPNTCDDVRKAAVSDGLVWMGTDLPTALPAEGHYVSLHIWPQSNFHWLRMDGDKMWSHKPGGTAVRNTDNNGKTISDPSKADVSPWSQHCGYLLATPSKSNITLVHAQHSIVV